MSFDGAYLQMRLSYSPAASFFLFFVQWTDCHLAGSLGLLRVLIYKAYANGKTTMSVHERKATLKEFYGIIFPSLLQLQHGTADEERKLEELRRPSEAAMEAEECGICMEMNTMVVLPLCQHSLCLKCYRDWRKRSQSCPFCRDCLKRVNSRDLWIYTTCHDVSELPFIRRENAQRFFSYIDRLPLLPRSPPAADSLLLTSTWQ